MNAPEHIPATGSHRPDAPALFAAIAAALAFAAAMIGTAVCIAGCAAPAPSRRSDAAPKPLVIGERVRVVRPGDVITVPDPVPPARTWYLADDEGLWHLTGLRAPNMTTFVTNDDQRVSLRRRAAQ